MIIKEDGSIFSPKPAQCMYISKRKEFCVIPLFSMDILCYIEKTVVTIYNTGYVIYLSCAKYFVAINSYISLHHFDILRRFIVLTSFHFLPIKCLSTNFVITVLDNVLAHKDTRPTPGMWNTLYQCFFQSLIGFQRLRINYISYGDIVSKGRRNKRNFPIHEDEGWTHIHSTIHHELFCERTRGWASWLHFLLLFLSQPANRQMLTSVLYHRLKDKEHRSKALWHHWQPRADMMATLSTLTA